MSYGRLFEIFDTFDSDKSKQHFALKSLNRSDATDRFINEAEAEFGTKTHNLFADTLVDTSSFKLPSSIEPGSVEAMRYGTKRRRLSYVAAHLVQREPSQYSALKLIERLTMMFSNGIAYGDKNGTKIDPTDYSEYNEYHFDNSYFYPQLNDCIQLLLNHVQFSVARDFLTRLFTGEFYQKHYLVQDGFEFNNYERIYVYGKDAVGWLYQVHAAGGIDDNLIDKLSTYFPDFLVVDLSQADVAFRQHYTEAVKRLEGRVKNDLSKHAETFLTLTSRQNISGIASLKAGLSELQSNKMKATELRKDEPYANSIRQLLRIEKLEKKESQNDLIAVLQAFDKKTLKIAYPYTGVAREQVMRLLDMENLISLDRFIQEIGEYIGDDPVYNSEDPENGVIDIPRIRHLSRKIDIKTLKSYLAEYSKTVDAPKNSISLIQAALGIDRQKTEGKLAKHGQLAIKAYGSFPVESQEDLQRRYKRFKKMHKAAAQYGYLRSTNTRAAVAAGLSNLAQSAGYTDKTRMEWALEAELADDTMPLDVWHTIEDWQVCLSICGTKPRIVIKKGEKKLKSVPSKVRQHAEYKTMRAAQDQIRSQASRFRDTLQLMMCQEEEITQEELALLRRMPVVAAMLNQLILRDAKQQIGIFNSSDSTLTSLQKDRLQTEGSLWIAHALDLFKADVLSQWQQTIVTKQVVQPFKQAFRELYIVTPAEIESVDSSMRFSGHQVEPRVASRLLQSRNWSLGNWEFPQSERIFAKQDTVALVEFEELGHYFAESDELTIGKIEFRRGDSAIALNKVDPLVFSEAMRDVDLVASVAQQTDDLNQWSEETANYRRQVISALTKTMGLTGVSVEKKHVLVTGKRASYKIHLGSAAIHVVPGNYLCIVPGRDNDDSIYLPFADNDTRMTEIVSKVLLLVNDDKIKDPSILSQIQRNAA